MDLTHIIEGIRTMFLLTLFPKCILSKEVKFFYQKKIVQCNSNYAYDIISPQDKNSYFLSFALHTKNLVL